MRQRLSTHEQPSVDGKQVDVESPLCDIVVPPSTIALLLVLLELLPSICIAAVIVVVVKPFVGVGCGAVVGGVGTGFVV